MAEENKFWSETEKGQKAEHFLATQNPYDISQWILLVKEAQVRNINEARCMFERVLERFPTSVRFIKLYIDREFKENNYDNVEKIYVRFLKTSYNVDLFKNYINFMKETKSKDINFKDIMQKAYEFALENAGIDFHSYHIWNDYISFLKSVEAPGAYAEGQKTLLLRKVYQQALCIPMINVDNIWKDYTIFEQSVNKMLGDKLVTDKIKDFSISRRVAKEIDNLTRGIHRHILALPPNSYPGEARQKSQWRKYLAWEKTNPLGLEHHQQVVRRVLYMYRQYLNYFFHHEDAWVDACQYVERFAYEFKSQGNQTVASEFQKEALELYERALNKPMAHSVTFRFSFADFKEICGDYEGVVSIYEHLLSVTTNPYDLSLIYIHYMKHARRVHGMAESRKIFKMARSNLNISFHVYVAAALQEFYINHDEMTSLKIFELALERFMNDSNFLCCYFEHLNRITDDSNVRMLFERLLNLSTEENLNLILMNFHRYESRFGSLNTVMELENRILSKYLPGSSYYNLLIDRYGFNDGSVEIASSFKLSSRNTKSILLQSHINDPDEKANQSGSTAPNVTQMRPFKPLHSSITHFVYPRIAIGGMFQPPEVVTDLLKLLPSAKSFSGPYVQLNKLFDFMATQSFDSLTSEFFSNRVGKRNYQNMMSQSSNMMGESANLDHSPDGTFPSKKLASSQPAEDGSDLIDDPMSDLFQFRKERRIRGTAM